MPAQAPRAILHPLSSPADPKGTLNPPAPHPHQQQTVLRRFLANYVERHQHPANQVLHLVGVPLTFAVSIIFLVAGQWWLAAAAFVGGYVLQFVGHAIEGNDAGEVVLVKKLLGRPYTEFGPLSKQSRRAESPDDTGCSGRAGSADSADTPAAPR